MNRWHIAVALILVGATFGCRASDTAQDQQEVLSASVDSLYVVEHSIELDEPDEYPIGLILDSTVDDDGTIYLTDFSSREVRAYDRDGDNVRLVGGTGQGPGEYTMPTAIAWNDTDHQLAVVDLGNARIVRYEGAEWETSTVSRIEVELGLKYLRFGANGQTVGAGLSRVKDLTTERTLAFASNGIDTVHFLPVPEPFLNSPYTRSIITGLVEATPQHIVAAITGHPLVYRFDYQGAVLDSVTLPSEIYGGVVLPEQLEDSFEFQKQYKWIQGIRSTSDGRVAVLELFVYRSEVDEWLQQIAWIPLDGSGPMSVTDPCDCRLIGVEEDQILLLRGAPPFKRFVEWRSHR